MKAQLAGMAWDVCGPTSGQASQMRVSINLGERRIYIPVAAIEAAGKPDMVQLLYSRAERSVAIRPVDHHTPNAVAMVRRSDRHTGQTASAAMLSRRLLADGYTGTLSVPVQWHPDGLLWGDLTMATKRAGKGKGGAA